MATKLLTPSNLKAVRFTLSGLEEYVERLNKVSANLDKIFEGAVKEIAEGVRADIKEWADKHKDTGAVAESVNSTDVMYNGSAVYAYVGIDGNINYDSWHAVFVEYGVPSKNMQADPGIRRAFEKWQKKAPKIYERYLKEALGE